MYKTYLILTLTILVSFGASAQTTNQTSQNNAINKIIEIGTTDNQSMNHLDILSNRFGGRLLGSDAYNNAADWCVYMFKKWGLEVVKQIGRASCRERVGLYV